jgi:hypothetical protein
MINEICHVVLVGKKNLEVRPIAVNKVCVFDEEYGIRQAHVGYRAKS